MSLINKSSLNEIFNFCMLNVPVSAWVDFLKRRYKLFKWPVIGGPSGILKIIFEISQNKGLRIYIINFNRLFFNWLSETL